MKNTLAIIPLLIISSCGNQHRNLNASTDEDFKSFYLKFNQDLSFQNSRIKYPLKGKYYTKNNKNPDFDYNFTLSDHLDFDNHKLDTTIYSIRRKMGNGVVEEKLFVPNSEVLTNYTFKLLDGKWFLVYYEEHDED